MIADLSPHDSQTAVRFLITMLRNPNIIISKDERIELESFISDLQDAIDNEAERQWLDLQAGG